MIPFQASVTLLRLPFYCLLILLAKFCVLFITSPTVKFIETCMEVLHCQPRNDQYGKLVGSHTVNVYYSFHLVFEYCIGGPMTVC